MSTHRHTSGGRTRNVVNIADPGAATAAYSEQEAVIAAPTGAAAGFKNFHSQKNLHIVVLNNNLNDGGAAMDVTVTVYGYNTSLGGVWAPLTIPISQGNGNALEYKSVATPAVANAAPFRAIIPIEGVERIAVATTFSAGTRDGGNYSIWLGVNTI
jgi:hypothetical protein